MQASLQKLLEGLIDYAGLFPPASLDMPAAVRNYAAYAQSAEAPWLGRFVLPVSRLEEFSAAVAALPAEPQARPWRLSALLGNDLAADMTAVTDFNRKAASQPRSTGVDVVEMKVKDAQAVPAALKNIPAGITAYFEIPVPDDPALLAAMARAGGRAKLRTGGVTPDMIPPSVMVARFLAACARAGVAFKATAGLHHPLRSLRRLTYAADSPSARMHGFLNVFLAAAFAANGMDEAALTELIDEENPEAFRFQDDGADWRGHRLATPQVQAARRSFAVAFGSCSFTEPRDDLREAGWL